MDTHAGKGNQQKDGCKKESRDITENQRVNAQMSLKNEQTDDDCNGHENE
jgi:hypothetical protein